MEVSSNIANDGIDFTSHRPIENQELLLSLIDYNGNGAPYFTEHDFTDVTYENVEVADTGDGDYYTYIDTTENDAQTPRIRWHFETTNRNPSTLVYQVSSQVRMFRFDLNSNHYRFYSPFQETSSLQRQL